MHSELSFQIRGPAGDGKGSEFKTPLNHTRHRRACSKLPLLSVDPGGYRSDAISGSILELTSMCPRELRNRADERNAMAAYMQAQGSKVQQ